MEQPLPLYPGSHLHLPLLRQRPWDMQFLGHTRMLHVLPVKPFVQKHVWFLHSPPFLHSGSQPLYRTIYHSSENHIDTYAYHRYLSHRRHGCYNFFRIARKKRHMRRQRNLRSICRSLILDKNHDLSIVLGMP